MFITGFTRTGKSTLARELFCSVSGRKAVTDPADSKLTAVPGAVTFSDPRRPPDAEVLRFVPRDPADLDAYDAFYGWMFEHFPIYHWMDEPDEALPANGWPRKANTYLVRGAKRFCGHETCATRPRHIMRSVVAQATHVFVFDLPIAEDRKYLADNIGVPIAEFEAARAEANALTVDTDDGPKGGFLWWNQVARLLTILPPLSLTS